MNFSQRCFSFITFLIVISEGILLANAHIGYSEAEQRAWGDTNAECNGVNQSPIAIEAGTAVPSPMPAVEMLGYRNLLPAGLALSNNGHSVSLAIPKNTLKPGESLPAIFGATLDSMYEVEGLHYHWGDTNDRGAEHLMDGVRHPMEMHIIHRNVKYADVGEALNHKDGLCVLGFFYHLSQEDGPELFNILRNVSSIEEVDKSIELDVTFPLHSLIANVDFSKFYTYGGSLTTPPCSEAVTFILYPDTIPVSDKQLKLLRQLSNGKPGEKIVDNYRSLQPLGNRQVFVRNVVAEAVKTKTTVKTVKKIYSSGWGWLF